MRVFVDEDDVPWEEAWEITVATLGYTNHTLLPEALEKWPVAIVERVLPRHLQIIYEINRRFLAEVEHRLPGDVSIPPGLDHRGGEAGEDDPPGHGRQSFDQRRRRAPLAPDHDGPGCPPLHRLHPERFNNKTNGVTPRRWLLKSNPGLASLLTEVAGPDWSPGLRLLREPLDRLAGRGVPGASAT